MCDLRCRTSCANTRSHESALAADFKPFLHPNLDRRSLKGQVPQKACIGLHRQLPYQMLSSRATLEMMDQRWDERDCLHTWQSNLQDLSTISSSWIWQQDPRAACHHCLILGFERFVVEDWPVDTYVGCQDSLDMFLNIWGTIWRWEWQWLKQGRPDISRYVRDEHFMPTIKNFICEMIWFALTWVATSLTHCVFF